MNVVSSSSGYFFSSDLFLSQLTRETKLKHTPGFTHHPVCCVYMCRGLQGEKMEIRQIPNLPCDSNYPILNNFCQQLSNIITIIIITIIILELQSWKGPYGLLNSAPIKMPKWGINLPTYLWLVQL